MESWGEADPDGRGGGRADNGREEQQDADGRVRKNS